MTKKIDLHRFNPGLVSTVLLTAAVLVAMASAAAAGDVFLELEANGLEDLGAGWAYEGWLIVDGAPVSTGTFTVSTGGMPSQTRFAVAVGNEAGIAAFVLTIEPVPDADPAPSAVHLLGGDFSGGAAALSVGHGAALGDDFTTAAGPYILNAPSGGGAADYFNGIWWLDPAAGPGPTLDLPELPAGWEYEGWVAGPDGPLSTGRFLMAAGADDDGQGITGGPFAAPPFPGQDLVNPPVELTAGYAAVISIEPEPDNSPAPFTLKPLVDGTIDDVGAGVLQDMDNMAAGFPTATVTVLEAADRTETAHLQLSLTGLEDLGAGWAYEGWLIVGGEAVSSGTFTVDGGVLSQSYFPTEVSSLEAISTFVLTIEPVPDVDPAPSSVHLLGGDFVGHRSALTIDHGAAIGTDFGDAVGPYILNAPSAGAGGDYRNGIWWLDPAGSPDPTLELPELPEGWIYEGWVAGAEGPVSTGRFSSASGEDSDGGGPDAGPNPTPPFPGQDFVDPAVDLTGGYAAVISVEPEPDNSPGPFTLKPLLDPVIDDVGAGVLQPMHSNPAALPAGSAVLLDEVFIPAGANTSGFANTRWLTDLDLENSGTASTTLVLQLLPADDAKAVADSATFMLAPMTSVRMVDVYGSVFDFEGVGALRVLVEDDRVGVDTRTYNNSDDGTFGQGIGPHTIEDAVGFGDIGRLLLLSQADSLASGFRTNIGFFNPDNSAVMVHVDLYESDGSFITSLDVELDGLAQTQLNAVFPAATEVGFAELWTSTPGGRFLAYGSVVDNRSGDPTFVAIQ